jgi:phosphatidylglycerophosphatase A
MNPLRATLRNMNPGSNVASEKYSNRPTFALAIATSLGLGYLPKAPGTWGSLGGVALAAGIAAATRGQSGGLVIAGELAFTVLVSLAGVWAGTRVENFSGVSDPQYVVIDEVSGQMIALVLGLTLHAWTARASLSTSSAGDFAATLASGLLNWKYLLTGFILFRVFDVWKPFPARQAESLPGGLGIMADDWIAGAFAALVLWFAQHFGL